MLKCEIVRVSSGVSTRSSFRISSDFNVISCCIWDDSKSEHWSKRSTSLLSLPISRSTSASDKMYWTCKRLMLWSHSLFWNNKLTFFYTHQSSNFRFYTMKRVIIIVKHFDLTQFSLNVYNCTLWFSQLKSQNLTKAHLKWAPIFIQVIDDSAITINANNILL